MEKHCSTIKFWLKSRTDKNGKSPITMTIGANGERAEFQTGKKIEPENWDNGKQQAKVSHRQIRRKAAIFLVEILKFYTKISNYHSPLSS